MAKQDDLIRAAELGFAELKSMAADSWSNLAIVDKVEAVRKLVQPIYEALRAAPVNSAKHKPRPRTSDQPAQRRPEPFDPVHVDNKTQSVP
jgi:hypothetical protein